MPRIRSIKPSFFLDEDLARYSTVHRLLFIGLWTLADKKGRLKDSPARIRAALFPYEEIDVEVILKDLSNDKEKFISRYIVSDIKYIQIKNFCKHQRPHHTEKESEIPDADGTITVNSPLLDGEKKVGMEYCFKGEGEGIDAPPIASPLKPKTKRTSKPQRPDWMNDLQGVLEKDGLKKQQDLNGDVQK